jgi:hypothetical protein
MEEARSNVVNSINFIARQMNLDPGAGAEDLVAKPACRARGLARVLRLARFVIRPSHDHLAQR